MKKTTSLPLSIATASKAQGQRITQQTLHVLDFIHRLRHVTTRHVQLSLRHATIQQTQLQLTRMRAKGYIERRYSKGDRAANRPASYFLTPEGLAVLKARNPDMSYRRVRSVESDAVLGMSSIQRCHTLADVYAHFKRHFEGKFEFFTAFDLAGTEYLPDDVPDGFVRLSLRGSGTHDYYIEVYGWGRPTYLQRRRLASYLQFAESEQLAREYMPRLFIVAPSQATRKRLNVQMEQMLAESLAHNLKVYTAVANSLDSEKASIWHGLECD